VQKFKDEEQFSSFSKQDKQTNLWKAIVTDFFKGGFIWTTIQMIILLEDIKHM
jgi:hypothetical protein